MSSVFIQFLSTFHPLFIHIYLFRKKLKAPIANHNTPSRNRTAFGSRGIHLLLSSVFHGNNRTFGYVPASRIRRNIRFSARETCTWVMSSAAATCTWVISSK